MQALWSRTAQARSCQCGPCLKTAARISRTSSTATARRRLRPSDVFTASFSAMLATAAVLDSRKKDMRISQWDQAIAEVRSGKDLATIRTPDQISVGKEAVGSSNIMGNQVREYTPDTNISRKLEQGTTTVKQLLGTIPMPILEAYKLSLKPSEPMAAVWDGLLSLLLESLEVSGDSERVLLASVESATEETDKDWDDRELDRASFYASRMLHRNPKTQRHLNRVEREVYAFVCELWKATSKTQHGVRSVSETANDDIKLEAKKMSGRLTSLMDGSKPFPTYQMVLPVGYRNDPRTLDKSIASILKTRGSDKGSLDLMVAKICCNLLTSATPPSITTYNIMIENFTRLRQHKLAEVVVNTFKTSRFSPDERTLSALLNHYTMTNDEFMFYTTIRQMAGYHGGLGIKRRHVYELSQPQVASWALCNKVMHRCGYLQQKADRNSQVFDTLIRGCLHFSNLPGAIRYLKTAIKEGCYIRTRLFTKLVQCSMDAAESKDALIRIVLALSLQWTPGIERKGGPQYNMDVRALIYDLLKACGLKSALSGVTDSLPPFICPESFGRMMRHINDEEAKDLVVFRSQSGSLLDPDSAHDCPEFRRSLLNDTPSFVKMSKVAKHGQSRKGREALMPPPLSPVIDGACFVEKWLRSQLRQVVSDSN